MKVFVAGATGVVGRRAVGRLVAAGHEVTALARSEEKAALLRGLGATPVLIDLFDEDAVRAAVAGHDVVCNVATHIPSLTSAARSSAWAENDRIRTEGSRILVDAAIAGGADRYIQESIAFQYADGGDRWLDESAAIDGGQFGPAVAAAEANAARFTAGGGVGVVLRFGMFYGPDTIHTKAQVRSARERIAPFVGRGHAYQSMIHVDDAAEAVVAALHAPAGVYNVTEDRPVTRAESGAALAAALGLPRLWQPPAGAAKLGGPAVALMSRSQRVSNHAFRTATGWAPAYPDAWSGWPAVVGASASGSSGSSASRRLLVRVALAILAFEAAVIGFWGTFAPRSFFDGFPGAGRHWVSVDGPYNHHLVGDVGALSLALLIVTVAALASRNRALIRTAGAAWVVSGLPHFVYHLTHHAGLDSGDLIASLTGLAFVVALGLVCVIAAPAAEVPAYRPESRPSPVVATPVG